VQKSSTSFSTFFFFQVLFFLDRSANTTRTSAAEQTIDGKSSLTFIHFSTACFPFGFLLCLLSEFWLVVSLLGFYFVLLFSDTPFVVNFTSFLGALFISFPILGTCIAFWITLV
jgi:hypothetical protein